MKRTLMSLALAVVLATALAGCGSDTTDGPRAEAEFNDADVTFAQAMIPHHEQAVVMAKVARTRASSPEVKQLAERIEAAQAPEIETMTGWLEGWGEDDSDASGHHMGGGHMMDDDDMPGMMSDADMSALGNAAGRAFDRMFLTMMISHHEGAVEMARTEQQEGKYPDAIRLAVRIEETQTSEIALMEDLLAS